MFLPAFVLTLEQEIWCDTEVKSIEKGRRWLCS